MQLNFRVAFQELHSATGSVLWAERLSAMDLLAARLIHDDVSEEGEELPRGMTRHGLAENFATYFAGFVRGRGDARPYRDSSRCPYGVQQPSFNVVGAACGNSASGRHRPVC